jgi:serine/threonine protein kinase
MIDALEYMHSLDLVHMDVKGSNIFIDQAGDWFLGDFGSTCVKGETVITSTPSFYPTNLGGVSAYPKYDWFMLLVAILIEMMPKKQEWYTELCDTEPRIVTLPRVAKALTKAIDSADVSEQLKRMLSIVAARTELLPSPPSSAP